MTSNLPPPATIRHLGRRPFIVDRRDIWLTNYLDRPKLAEAIDASMAPRLVDWATLPLPSGARPQPDTDPLFNDQAGCCVFSMAGHKVNLVAQHALSPVRVTAEMVRDAYAKRTGYDPVTRTGDNGAYIREDLLKPWKRDGLWGTKLLAYAQVNWTNPEEVALANWLCGGLMGGYNLPAIYGEQVDAHGRPQWTRPESGWPPGQGPSSSRGHAIYTHGERSGNTWGQGVVMDQSWVNDACDELWFGLLDIWQVGWSAPNGFAWQDLFRDAEARSGA